MSRRIGNGRVNKPGRSCLALVLLVYAAGGMAQETFSDCDECPTMVRLPPGSVTVGSSEQSAYRRPGERLAKQANISEHFAMAQTEVTLAQYRYFVNETNHESAAIEYQGRTILGCNYFDGTSYGFVTRHTWQNPGFPQREDDPVVCVSWSDANSYAQWLKAKTGRTYRVPSAVEFEYALRAGTDTPWFWGSDPDKACEFANIADQTFGRSYPTRSLFACDDRYTFPTKVARFKANAFGLHDMLGNAWEWTNDCWHDDLANAPLDGSSWQEDQGGDCDFRTPKGGSWISGPSWSHAAVRSKDLATYRSFMLGFRVAATIDD